MQVFVDEATDFSAVQLACMLELAHPQLRSWFACGDPNQRITHHGVRNLGEIDWVQRNSGDAIEFKEIHVPYRQSHRLSKLVTALEAEAAGVIHHEESDAQDAWPLLAEHLKGDALAQWVADRIIEVERAVGETPLSGDLR